MSTNSKNNSKKLNLLEKTVITGIGAILSKDTINKAATTIFNDIQKEIKKLLNQLETKGEIKAKETEKIIGIVKTKAEKERNKIYIELKKQSKPLLNTTKGFVSSLFATAKNGKVSLKKKSKSRSRRSKKK